jgi:WD40 repeat protein
MTEGAQATVETLNDEGVTSDNGPIPSGWPLFSNPKKPVLVSGSLDNTMQMWDIDTGKSLRTCFGHIEGIWGVSADKLRLATASQDRTIKVCFNNPIVDVTIRNLLSFSFGLVTQLQRCRRSSGIAVLFVVFK